jgi:hypothetical protein
VNLILLVGDSTLGIFCGSTHDANSAPILEQACGLDRKNSILSTENEILTESATAYYLSFFARRVCLESLKLYFRTSICVQTHWKSKSEVTILNITKNPATFPTISIPLLLFQLLSAI